MGLIGLNNFAALYVLFTTCTKLHVAEANQVIGIISVVNIRKNKNTVYSDVFY